MELDPTRVCELLVGLEGVNVLGVDRRGDVLLVMVGVRRQLTACRACGTVVVVKDRDWVELGDLPAFRQPAVLVWVKRRCRCPAPQCPQGSWTEQHPAIAAARCGLTRRAGLWATVQVGREGRSIASVAEELRCSWQAVSSAVWIYGQPLLDDPARTAGVEMLGVDETSFLRATPRQSTRFLSAVVHIARPAVADLIEGRHAPDLNRGLADRPAAWKDAVKVTVCDLHEPFHAALTRHFPDALHVVGVATRALDKTRRRVQNETLGHRGRTADPLYRARRLLANAADTLDDRGQSKLRGLLAAGDPDGHVNAAWLAKECLRDLSTLHGAPDVAAAWLEGLIDDRADSPPGSPINGPHPASLAPPRSWRGTPSARRTGLRRR